MLTSQAQTMNYMHGTPHLLLPQVGEAPQPENFHTHNIYIQTVWLSFTIFCHCQPDVTYHCYLWVCC